MCFMSQISSSILASRLPPVCRKHIRRFQSFIAHSTSYNTFICLFSYTNCFFNIANCCLAQQTGDWLDLLVFFLFVQDIPFFFTLQNTSHVVSYIILKAVHREVSASVNIYSYVQYTVSSHTLEAKNVKYRGGTTDS